MILLKDICNVADSQMTQPQNPQSTTSTTSQSQPLQPTQPQNSQSTSTTPQSQPVQPTQSVQQKTRLGRRTEVILKNIWEPLDFLGKSLMGDLWRTF
ncbi:hypothetical protein MiSe_08440 [Microseira wollei NIES-4236]|uniref:Uncharacterized protein n=2 Tax=Microseira wollei TaxID=467598 RepID=A0AAV3X4F2_9CYAN|nr:hypothetical protein MiSe_08440 [Microseira wollei NIES-4236]